VTLSTACPSHTSSLSPSSLPPGLRSGARFTLRCPAHAPVHRLLWRSRLSFQLPLVTDLGVRVPRSD